MPPPIDPRLGVVGVLVPLGLTVMAWLARRCCCCCRALAAADAGRLCLRRLTSRRWARHVARSTRIRRAARLLRREACEPLQQAKAEEHGQPMSVAQPR